MRGYSGTKSFAVGALRAILRDFLERLLVSVSRDYAKRLRQARKK